MENQQLVDALTALSNAQDDAARDAALTDAVAALDAIEATMDEIALDLAEEGPANV